MCAIPALEHLTHHELLLKGNRNRRIDVGRVVGVSSHVLLDSRVDFLELVELIGDPGVVVQSGQHADVGCVDLRVARLGWAEYLWHLLSLDFAHIRMDSARTTETIKLSPLCPPGALRVCLRAGGLLASQLLLAFGLERRLGGFGLGLRILDNVRLLDLLLEFAVV